MTVLILANPAPPKLAVRSRHRGFTLLELLVVMTLLSIIMIGLVSALRTMAQTETRIDQRLERLDEIRVARSFLQQTLGRVSALTVDAPGATGKKIVPFVLTPDSLTWVGIMPARPNVGGRHFFRLAMEDTSGGLELVLRFAPWGPDAAPPNWPTAESRVLIKGIKQVNLQAQGLPPDTRNSAEPWPRGWQNGWPVADVLPEQVRLKLVDAQGEWPDWTLPIRALPQGDSGFSRVVVGGGK
jgi:general secretion pathway protein J